MKYAIGTRIKVTGNKTMAGIVGKEGVIFADHPTADACIIKLDNGTVWLIYDADLTPIGNYQPPVPPDYCKSCNGVEIIATEEMVECEKCGSIFIIESNTLIEGAKVAYG